MIRIAVVGEIGSGKTHVSKLFGYPVFNADKVVSDIYLKNKKVYNNLKKKIPGIFSSFPIKKNELIKAVVSKNKNLKTISSIVHPIVRVYLKKFLIKNKDKKVVVLDIPLFLENKMNIRGDVVIFVNSNKKERNRRLILRKNFNRKILIKLKKIQLPIYQKRKKSDFIIDNNFKDKSTRKVVKNILKKILA